MVNVQHTVVKEGKGTQVIFGELGQLWKSRTACRALQALMNGARSQRTLQRELGMKASLVSDAVRFLEKGRYIRTWTQEARRDKLYGLTSHGLYLASLVNDLAEQNQITDILISGRGSHHA